VELYVLLYPLGGGMTLFYHDTTETCLAAEFLHLLPVTSLNYGGSTSFRGLFVFGSAIFRPEELAYRELGGRVRLLRSLSIWASSVLSRSSQVRGFLSWSGLWFCIASSIAFAYSS